MKKVLIVLGLLFLLAAAAVAVFVATFDADRYRLLVVNQMEQVLGSPVRLEKISLGWRGGIALQLKNLAIYPAAPAHGEPLVRVENVSAVVRLLPLLKKNVQIASVRIDRPRLHILRTPEGAIRMEGIQFPAEQKPTAGSGPQALPAEPAPQTVAAPAALPLAIGLIEVSGGEIRVSDDSLKPPLDLTLKKLDLTLRNVSLSRRPIQFQARVAVFSDDQNLILSGRFEMPGGGQPGLLEAFQLQTDFSRLKTADFAEAFPSVKGLGLRELKGNLSVKIDRLVLDPQNLAGLEAQVALVDGRILSDQFPKSVDQITMNAVARRDRILLNRFSAAVAGGTVNVTGKADNLDTRAGIDFQATAQQLALEDLTPLAHQDQPHLRGKLSLTFHGTAQGLAADQMARTLSGNGEVHLTQGVMVNFNVLQEVFRRISIIPGLVEVLQSRLPESYRDKMNARDTVLEPVDLTVTADNGAFVFNNLRLATDTFELTGTGRLGTDMNLSSQTTLRIGKELSAAIIRSVREFQSLSSPDGRIELPVQVQGTLPAVSALPDVQYVASRLVANKAGDVLGNLLSKVLEKASK